MHLSPNLMYSLFIVWWLSGKFGALRTQGCRFEPHPSHHVGTLGESFSRSWLYNVMWHPEWLLSVPYG